MARIDILIDIEDACGFSSDECRRIYYFLIDHTSFNIGIVGPTKYDFLSHGRLNILTSTEKGVPLTGPELRTLVHDAKLVVSTNGSLLKLVAGTDTTTLGVWLDYKVMVRAAIPRHQQANVVLRMPEARVRPLDRVVLNTVECFDRESFIKLLLDSVIRMLTGCRYVRGEAPGADLQLQHLILDWQGHLPTRLQINASGNYIHSYNDRHRSFDLLFRLISERFTNPTIVETGCLREQDNFKGDGYSTYIFASLVRCMEGQLISIEVNSNNCEFARQVVEPFKDAATVVCEDSKVWLKDNGNQISVLYLDSMDTFVRGAAEHGLAEIQAAYDQLVENALVVYDDTVITPEKVWGKGELGVPWLLECGWEVIYSGYQTILQRRGEIRNYLMGAEAT